MAWRLVQSQRFIKGLKAARNRNKVESNYKNSVDKQNGTAFEVVRLTIDINIIDSDNSKDDGKGIEEREYKSKGVDTRGVVENGREQNESWDLNQGGLQKVRDSINLHT